jgi:hypothetical protein
MRRDREGQAFLATFREELSNLERDFDQLLRCWDRFHDSVQCPTGANEQAVRAMHEYAEVFNQRIGKMVVLIDWKPVSVR